MCVCVCVAAVTAVKMVSFCPKICVITQAQLVIGISLMVLDVG